MTTETVEITSKGIRKLLNKYSPEQAIAEYIWNGFDAKATIVKVDFEVDSTEFDTFKSIRITDNGNGICFEELPVKFKKFYESEKINNIKESGELTKGKNGYGRLTFYKFAHFAEWQTTYKRNSEKVSYHIQIKSENLKDYLPSTPEVSSENIGTSVIFKEILTELSSIFIDQILKPYLRAEFAWFLELKEEFKIIINGIELDYSSIIAEVDNFSIKLTDKNGVEFGFLCKYIRWNTKLNDEYSKFYFLNDDYELKNTKTTLLNKKGDDFWHSIVVLNDFFNEINSEKEDKEATLKLFEDKADAKMFKDLVEKLNNYLKGKRKPFLHKQAEILINKYESDKVFPKFKENEWDKARETGLKNLVKGMYEVEPAVFTKLNKEQKRIFLELLNLVLDSSERESLFKIIEAVIDLDSEDRDELAKILETTRLKQVITTINLIKDRLVALEGLKKLVFNHDLKANERDHLQKYIEKHYWIFGEEYRMVCAEEVKFEGALRKYIYILRGVDQKTFIEHPDKYKEMDLFLTGADFRDGKPHNVVIEIKNPTTIKKLKSEQMTQLEEYMDVILKQDCFNDMNEDWSFYLIGQDYDDILGRRIHNKNTGLVLKGDNYSAYIKKWSEITNEVDRRLKYLLEKLKIERSFLSQQNTVNEILEIVPTIEN
jgi:hypothetical protein